AASVPVLEPLPEAPLPVVLLPLLGLLLEPMLLPDEGVLLLLGVALLLLLGDPMLLLLLDVSVGLGDGVEEVVVLGSGDFAGSLLPPQAAAIATIAPRAN